VVYITKNDPKTERKRNLENGSAITKNRIIVLILLYKIKDRMYKIIMNSMEKQMNNNYKPVRSLEL
jgi:hypothetical protein